MATAEPQTCQQQFLTVQLSTKSDAFIDQ